MFAKNAYKRKNMSINTYNYQKLHDGADLSLLEEIKRREAMIKGNYEMEADLNADQK